MTEYLQEIVVAGIRIPMGWDPEHEDEHEALWIKAGETLLDSGKLEDKYYAPTNCEMYAVITAANLGLRAAVDRFLANLNAWLDKDKGEHDGERIGVAAEGEHEAVAEWAGQAAGEDRGTSPLERDSVRCVPRPGTDGGDSEQGHPTL